MIPNNIISDKDQTTYILIIVYWHVGAYLFFICSNCHNFPKYFIL